MIKQGKQSLFVIGGSDEISMFDEKMIKEPPYEGQILSEGAASLVVESDTHAKARGASIYAQVDGFSMTSAYYDQAGISESYSNCIQNTLRISGVSEERIHHHIPSVFGQPLPQTSLRIERSSSQTIVGTLESSTAILNVIYGTQLLQRGLDNILVSGVSVNGCCYSFVLKKPD
jgi:hypothetical protein